MEKLTPQLSTPELALAGHLTTYKGVHAPMQEITIKNPMNVMEAARPVWNRIQTIKEADPKAKIIVNCGEDHRMSIFSIFNLCLIDCCIRGNLKTVYADERPHNMLLSIGNQALDMNIAHDQIDILKQQDASGLYLSFCALRFLITSTAPKGKEAVYKSNLKRNVSTVFTDAARIYDELDLKDSLTRNYFSGKCPTTFSVDGMVCREKVMYHNQKIAIDDQDIIIQNTGSNHVSGLYNLFQHKQEMQNNIYQISILPVLQSDLMKNDNVDSSFLKNTQNTFTIFGLDETVFNHRESPIYRLLDQMDDHLLKAEDRYIQSIIKHSDNFIDVEPCTEEKRSFYEQKARKFFRSLPPEFKRAP